MHREVNMIQVYLLEVGELRRQMEKIASTGENMDTAVLPGWDKLADWQQGKVSRCAQPGARALCMGGQLLLQYGAHRMSVCEKPTMGKEGNGIRWQQLVCSQLLEGIVSPLPLQVAYASKGKPYIRHVPWHYNLSHSGDYAALAISDALVGIDIQQMKPYRETLVKRFFSEEEQQSVMEMTLFYTLWCRKEAYGKLKGTGLTEDVLRRNMLEETSVQLYEYGEIPGCRICVCSERPVR